MEQWLEGHEGKSALHWLPHYTPECKPGALLNDDLKQELKNEPMLERTVVSPRCDARLTTF